MEQIAIETANDRDLKYVYALAVAVLHILEWIVKNEGRLLPNDK